MARLQMIDGRPEGESRRLRVPPPKPHQVNVCHRLHAVKTPAIPGETALGAMRCSHRHVSDDARTASPEPKDAGKCPPKGSYHPACQAQAGAASRAAMASGGAPQTAGVAPGG